MKLLNWLDSLKLTKQCGEKQKMSKLTGAALDRAVANAMGLKSVNNCEQWGKEMTEEDDDIQEYKKPWVGLTYEEESELIRLAHNHAGIRFYIQAAEAKLKEKNT